MPHDGGSEVVARQKTDEEELDQEELLKSKDIIPENGEGSSPEEKEETREKE